MPLRKNHKRKATNASMVLDMCGPFRTSESGLKYMCLFLDDATDYSYVVFVKNKSDLNDALTQYKALVKTQTGSMVKLERADRGENMTDAHYVDMLWAGPWPEWES